LRLWIKPKSTADLLAIELLRELAADHLKTADPLKRPTIGEVWERVALKFSREITPELRRGALDILHHGSALNYSNGAGIQYVWISDEGIAALNRYEAARRKTNWPALALWVTLAGLVIAVLTFCRQLRR